MAENRSYLAIFTIILTLIGVVVITFNEAWGVTIIFFSILFLGGYIVRNRLQAIGAEAFALGSVIVWLGFFTLSLPLLDFAWGFVDQAYQLLLFFGGLVLILIGFTTEVFNLNQRFLDMLQKIQVNLSEAWAVIRQKLFRSVWTGLAVIFLIAAVISFFTETLEFIPHPFSFEHGLSLTFVLLAVTSILVEFRAILILAGTTVFEFSKLFATVIWIRLKNVPGLIYDSLLFIYDLMKQGVHWVLQLIPSLIRNIYVFGFGGSIIFGIFAVIRSDSLLGAGSIILLLISLINLVGTRQEAIERRVAGIQQSTYSRSLRLRNLIRREYSGNCFNCGVELGAGQNYCHNCGQYTPDCMVCRDNIYAGDDTLICPNCEVAGHAEHLERWLSIKPTCPNCRERWS